MPTDTQSHPTKKPLNPIAVGAAIWLFFPLGFYLLWRHPTLSRNAKWWLAGLAWASLVVFVGSKSEPDHASAKTKTDEAIASDSPPAEKPPKSRSTGKNFSDKQMEELCRKAFTLRLGMSESEVFRIMGPPTKREVFNPADHALPGLPVVDPRPQDTSTWSSASDPGYYFIMVTLMEGRAVDINANKKGGSILHLSEILK